MVASMSPSLCTVTPVALTPPKATSVAPEKPVPWMATGVPPAAGPLLGMMLVIAGSAMS
jgi:hypothetical protein